MCGKEREWSKKMEQEEQKQSEWEILWEEELSRRIERDCRRYVRMTALQEEDDA